MRYRAVISYDGTDYVGWQKQLNGISVQEVLEKAFFKIFGAVTAVTASGRTDAGVHALGQVVHFDAETSIPANKIPFAVNTELPSDISVLSCEIADDDFNARFSAKRKTYCYKLYLSKHRLPLLENDHTHIVIPLDLVKMRQAADLIEGTHDFKAFEASGSVIKNTVRTVYGIEISCIPLQNKNIEVIAADRAFDCEVAVSVTGNGFLYNMVRIIAGTLVYVGNGKLTVEDVNKIFENNDRTLAGKTLPAKGLSLVCVDYN